jgi:pimeloyl-ACP methyl ester carboxylesterase
MVDDLCELMDHLRLSEAALGGLSMGGNVVLNFALAHPERVSALILADTGAGSDDAARMVARALQGAEVLEHESRSSSCSASKVGNNRAAHSKLFRPRIDRTRDFT